MVTNHLEYLLFNIVVILGPLCLSFDHKVRFVRRWSRAFAAIIMTAIPFLIWDVLVTGRHWRFNPEFTLDLYLLNLPIEEWLFFLTVPFSSLFIWDVLHYYFPKGANRFNEKIYHLAIVFLLMGLIFFGFGKEYTGLTLIVWAGVMKIDQRLRTCILLQWNMGRYALILLLLMTVFNGYLTARPVVLYQPEFQLGWRLITIPIEDFVYGYSLVLLATILYERIKRGEE